MKDGGNINILNKRVGSLLLRSSLTASVHSCRLSLEIRSIFSPTRIRIAGFAIVCDFPHPTTLGW